ncbi:hypothetical protein N8766_06180 [bacterium]|nr:hypothetical protein [bacterium]
MAVDGSNARLDGVDDGCRDFFDPLAQEEGRCGLARVSVCYDLLNRIPIDATIAPFAVGERSLAVGHLDYSVTIVMQLATRRVSLAGVYLELNGAWVEQIGRRLVDGFGGVLTGQKYLIHDRGTVFTEKFLMILEAGGVKTLKLPARSPI